MFHISSKYIFTVGIIFGVFLSIIYEIIDKKNIEPKLSSSRIFNNQQYGKWFTYTNLTRKILEFDEIRYSNKTFHLESSYLYKKIDVLCVILVRNHRNAEAAQNTWAKGCNIVKLIYLEETKNSKKIVIRRKRENSSWIILCKNIFNVPEPSWTIIVYDYTFVILENLRMHVAGLNPNDNYYLGHTVKFWNTVYNMGQAGYVLSRGTVRSLKKKLASPKTCGEGLTYRNQEDYYLGKYLSALNIKPCDTRDDNGLSTFQPYNLYHVFFPTKNYFQFSIYPVTCCSSKTITFQAIEGDKMYFYYYLLYTVQRFQYGTFGNKLPLTSSKDDEGWKNFLRKRGVSEHISDEEYYQIWKDLVDDPTLFARNIRRAQMENGQF